MRWMPVVAAVLGMATAGLWAWDRSRPRPVEGPPIVSGSLDPLKHRVDAEMEEASREHDGGRVPSIRLEASGGEMVDLSTVGRERPAVVMFIKEECPCSMIAERYFARLYEAYGSDVAFLGIIDGSRGTAERWVEQQGTPFPVVHDPELRAMREMGATNSAFVAVVRRGGEVEKLWPGFSRGMLEEVSSRLAALAGAEPREIDTTGAPGELYTGCPFGVEETTR